MRSVEPSTASTEDSPRISRPTVPESRAARVPDRRPWDNSPVKDWVEWHAGYDFVDSSLSRRLVVVKSSLLQALEAPRDHSAVLLSLCAGDGRDVISVLKERSVGVRQAVLVELDQTLASRAKQE